MKKTFYHNLFPSKAEEEAYKATNTPWQTTRVLVEIRDVHPPPAVDFQKHPWQIKKALTQYEVITGKLVVSFLDTFEHLLRYWTLCLANHVVLGHKVSVILWDVTDHNNPKRYRGEAVYFELSTNNNNNNNYEENYSLACMELFKDRCLTVDDEIGLYWDPRASTFQFKLLSNN